MTIVETRITTLHTRTAPRLFAPAMTLARITAALERNDPQELLHVPIALSMEPPEADHPGYAEMICRQLAAHADPNVRGNALLGFGHLARTSGIIWKPKDVRALVEAGLADPNDYVRGQADADDDDLHHFLEWKPKKAKSRPS